MKVDLPPSPAAAISYHLPLALGRGLPDEIMSNAVRYAVYWMPPEGPLARFGAAWLGWDAAAGVPVAHPPLSGIPQDEIAAATHPPRKYGLHATFKPPLCLAPGVDPDDLTEAVSRLAAAVPPLDLDGLALAPVGRFLALVPEGCTEALDRLAFHVVERLDELRAPPLQGELDRRRAAGLSARQDALLVRWGYPYVADEFHFHVTLTGPLGAERRAIIAQDVADEFHFHVTLTGPLGAERRAIIAQALRLALEPMLPRPLPIEELVIVRQGEDGRFRLVSRHRLGG